MNESGTLLLNQVSAGTTRLAPGRHYFIAVPFLGEKPLDQVSRIVQNDEKTHVAVPGTIGTSLWQNPRTYLWGRLAWLVMVFDSVASGRRQHSAASS